MTSFMKDTILATLKGEVASPPPQPEQETPKIDLLQEPRFKNDPVLWAEALRFANMLTYCRPHLSRTESRFINEYIRPIGISFDKFGNVYKKIGSAPVLWSCHIDTVHNQKGFQKIEYWVDKTSGDTFLGVAAKEKSSCLGADDTAGIFIMLEMIRANVPGLYIFHRGEECGGLGSKWIAKNNPDALKDIRFAVAFDRRDTGSIITYQRGTRCCSDEFANSLTEQLGMQHKCDETGSFTDTASYVDLIAECTNISAGYYNAHDKSEKVNVDYLFNLRDAICKIDVAKLIEKRKPGENTRKSWRYACGKNDFFDDDDWSGWGGTKDYQIVRPTGAFTFNELTEKYGNNKWLQYYGYDSASGFWLPLKGKTPPTPKPQPKKDLGVTKLSPDYKYKPKTDYYSSYRGSYNEMVAMIRLNPQVIADLLESQGYGPLEIRDYINKANGIIAPPY